MFDSDIRLVYLNYDQSTFSQFNIASHSVTMSADFMTIYEHPSKWSALPVDSEVIKGCNSSLSREGTPSTCFIWLRTCAWHSQRRIDCTFDAIGRVTLIASQMRPFSISMQKQNAEK